jgi:hypothetical protein
MPPYVIASGAKQSPLPHDPRLLCSARNDTARVFRTAAVLAQNAAIERLAEKDARISCSKNRETIDSSTEHMERELFRVFRGEKQVPFLMIPGES